MALERCYSKGREIKYLVLWHSLWPASFYCYSSEDVKRVLLMWLGLNKTCCIVFFICTILLCKVHVLFKCRSFFQLKFLLFFLYQMLLIIVLIVIKSISRPYKWVHGQFTNVFVFYFPVSDQFSKNKFDKFPGKLCNWSNSHLF